MRVKAYFAHPSIPDHWALKCISRCPDQVVSQKQKPQCFSPQASLVLFYRTIEGMKGWFDLAQPEDRTPDLWCGSVIHYHSATGPVEVFQ
ncbi:hypothetical protein TNCV_3062831 [Trichonephila clavipes]|nr:hypothetical protein TNCV_3062831 [Trichonephila clavipes]